MSKLNIFKGSLIVFLAPSFARII